MHNDYPDKRVEKQKIICRDQKTQKLHVDCITLNAAVIQRQLVSMRQEIIVIKILYTKRQ